MRELTLDEPWKDGHVARRCWARGCESVGAAGLTWSSDSDGLHDVRIVGNVLVGDVVVGDGRIACVGDVVGVSG